MTDIIPKPKDVKLEKGNIISLDDLKNWARRCGFEGCDKPYDDGHTHEIKYYGFFTEPEEK